MKNVKSKVKNKQANAKKIEVSKKISYYRKPDDLSIDKWQAALRWQFGQDNDFTIQNIGEHRTFSDFLVFNNQTQNSYKVAIRSADDSANFCECLDFKTNRLGICKHISAVFKFLEAVRGSKIDLKNGFSPTYSSVYLDYRSGLEVKIRVGSESSEAYSALAKKYFDANFTLKSAAFGVFELFLEDAKQISDDFRCYSDALDFVIEQRDKIRRRDYLWRIMPDGMEDAWFDKNLKIKLFPYQKEGVFFAALAGRSLIADEMGLGKTVQAIATAQLYRQELGINRVLIVCPTSLKYQWKSEIEKFTESSVHVVEGTFQKRKEQYEKSTAFYLIVSYHAVLHDVDLLNKMEADMVFLDEAQRIKNWKSKISQQIKKLRTPYALVLTGTPLENKLEELYSIMQFIDVFQLGPLYHFLNRYQISNESGKVVGYQHLHEISEILADTLIRRTKKEVISQLPKRMDKNLFVPMTEDQMIIHNELQDITARLVAKWQRMGFLNEIDRKRLILSLSQMRMVCDSTYILDQRTRHDTKIDELMNILDEFLEGTDEKVVVFSQWERMTRLVSQELDQRNLQYEYLHGGVESKNRKYLLENFRDDPNSRVFLSTDAGGVGLNLQAASLLINLDIPWNPAVLEQRIARIYRLGQERNVSIINLVSTGTIEHKMLDVLKFKATMAAGVLDGGDDTIFLGEDRFKQFMNAVESLTDAPIIEDLPLDMPEEHKTEAIQTPEPSPELLVDKPETATTFLGDDDVQQTESSTQSVDNQAVTQEIPIISVVPNPEELVKNGLNFFMQLAQTLKNPEATKQLVSSITQKDESGKTYLKIPIENEQVIENAVSVLSGLLGAFMK